VHTAINVHHLRSSWGMVTSGGLVTYYESSRTVLKLQMAVNPASRQPPFSRRVRRRQL
jgi:hypothetical protein